MRITLVAMFLMVAMMAGGQSLYIKTFGNRNDNPVIFLHGGPGYNCANFEATTAQPLADQGFFVIVYDRRGEGRSTDPNASYTFKETFNDLNNIYSTYGLSKATLIGHSFGGIVATLFAEAYPATVESVILVGAPVSLQETFKNIISRSESIYQAKKDTVNLNYILMLEKMDTTSLEYSSYSFQHAMVNGFYSPGNPTDEARRIYSAFRADTVLLKYASQMTYQAPFGFWKNERYTTIDLTNNLESLVSRGIEIFGLYGKDDGLYSTEQVMSLQKQIGLNHLNYLDNCSHNVFIDRQHKFIESIKLWAE